MRKFPWVKLHIYCGLFTSFYLLAFGFSSIVLNHNINVEKDAIADIWTTQVSFDPTASDLDIAIHIRDTLNLMGWVPPWEIKKDSLSMNFQITHLAKTTNLQLNFATGILHVKERPKGFMAVLHELHFFNGQIPNAPFLLKTWIVYQWLTLFVLLISLFTGLWFWFKHSYKTWELVVFVALFIESLIVMTLL
ncbi:hypothetical protein MASR2M47_28420 [Draconibacterium sp.]|jgi:hypothetical protein